MIICVPKTTVQVLIGEIQGPSLPSLSTYYSISYWD